MFGTRTLSPKKNWTIEICEMILNNGCISKGQSYSETELIDRIQELKIKKESKDNETTQHKNM
jgi:hypothetical protein